MQNKVHMQAFQSIGIQPTPMAFPELFTALQQGTVDGQENPIPVILSAKFAQVQKHLSLTGHVYSPALLIVSPAFGTSCRTPTRPRSARRARRDRRRSARRSTTTSATASRSCARPAWRS